MAMGKAQKAETNHVKNRTSPQSEKREKLARAAERGVGGGKLKKKKNQKEKLED